MDSDFQDSFMRYSPLPTTRTDLLHFGTKSLTCIGCMKAFNSNPLVNVSLPVPMSLLLNYRFCNGSQYLVGRVTPPCSSVKASLQLSVLLDKNLTHQVPGESHNPVMTLTGAVKTSDGENQHVESQPHCP